MTIKNVQSDGTTIVVSFPSWFDYVDEAKFRTATNKDEFSHLDDKLGHNSWFGIGTFKQAYDLADKGWQEGLKRISATGEALFDDLSHMIRRPVVAMSEEPGMDFDVARVVEGEPEHWVHIEDAIKRGSSKQIIRLVFNASSSAGVSTDVVMAKGTMVAALVLLLEYSGAACEVVLFCGGSEFNEHRVGYQKRGKTAEIYATVKHADSPLDTLALAYALAHPATFRRFAFSIMEGLPKEYCDALIIPGLYGYACEASHQGDLYIPSARTGFTQWTDPKLARRWVIDTLKAQGIALHQNTP